MYNGVEGKFDVYTFYDILLIPFNKNISHPRQVTEVVDFTRLKDTTKDALLTLPIVQFTGDFKAGGLSKVQRLYLMTKMDEVYLVDTLKTNYARCVTKLINVPDLSDKEVVERSDEYKSIQRVRKSESYQLTYNEVDYVIEITEEDTGTFTSIMYGNNFVMDYILEQDILEYFNQNK